MRSALVAGVGFIGANLARELVAAGTETWAFVRLDSPRRQRVEAVRGLGTLQVPSYGLADLERAVGDRSFDVVYNALGPGTSHSELDWEALLEGNVRVALDVARLAASSARRLVQLGTCQEYAPKEAAAGPLTESDRVGPISPYGASKAAAQPLLAHVCQRGGIDYVHARLFNTYGPFEADNRIVPYLARRFEAGEPAELTEGSQVRDFTFVGDTCQALVRLGGAPLTEPAPVFNVCSGTAVSVRDLVLAAADVLGTPRALLRFGAKPQRGNEPLHLVGSNARLREATGWRPLTSLAGGIELTIAECRTRSGARG